MKDNITILKDRNGIDLPDDCIIHGWLANDKDEHYFRLGKNWKGELEMYACTYGYVHNVEQKDIMNFELVGLAKENLHLLECD